MAKSESASESPSDLKSDLRIARDRALPDEEQSSFEQIVGNRPALKGVLQLMAVRSDGRK